MSNFVYEIVSGTAEVSNADVNETVLAAVSGKSLRLLKGVVMVTVVADGGGEAALEDGAGGTKIFEVDTDALGVYPIDFGDEGYPLTSGNVLNLNVSGATTEGTVRATFIARAV